jgi:hypothetical protein
MNQIAPTDLKHDFDNQLGVVVSYSDLLLSELRRANEHRRDIEKIECAARQLMRLFHDWARTERSHASIPREAAGHLAVMVRSCECLLTRLPESDALVVDVRAMLKAAHVIVALVPQFGRGAYRCKCR